MKLIIPIARSPAMMKMEQPAKGENCPFSLLEFAEVAPDMWGKYLFSEKMNSVFRDFLALVS